MGMRTLVVVTWLLATTACVDSPSMDDSTGEPVRMETEPVSIQAEWASIEFEWGIPYLLEGETRYVDVVVFDSLGREVSEPVPVQFTASDPSRIWVHEDGSVTGLRAGQVEVIATLEDLEARLIVDVEPDEPAYLRPSATSVEMSWLDEVDFGAIPFNEHDRMLAAPVTWHSADALVATVDADGTVRGIANGETKILATAGQARVEFDVRVVSPPVSSIEVTDAPLYLYVGDEDQVTAVALAEDLRTIDDAVLTFSSQQPGIVWVEPDTGRVKALAEGAAKVVIRSGAVRRIHQLFVQPAPAN